MLTFIIVIPVVSAATIYGTVFDTELNQAKNVRVTVDTIPEQKIIAVSGRYSVNVNAGTYKLLFEQLDGDVVQARAIEEVVIGDNGSFIRDILLLPYFGDEEEMMSEIDAITVETLEQPAAVNKVIILLLVIVVIVVIFLAYRINKLLRSFKKSVLDKKKNGDEKEDVESSKPVKGSEENKEKENLENSINPKSLAEQIPVEPHIASEALIKKIAPPEGKKFENLPEDLQQIVDFIVAQEGRATQKEIRKHMPQSEAKVSLMLADLVQRAIVTKIKKGRGNIIVLKDTQTAK
jgi:uncharacterized membrane protein